jgi:hypothetical protein
MDNLEMVFLGTHTFTFTLPSTAEVEKENYETTDVPGFEAVCTFHHLDELRSFDEPVFAYAQAVAVSKIENYDFRGSHYASVLAFPEAAHWVLCFPVRRLKTRYAPQTKAVTPDGEDVFYTFSSVVTNDSSKTFIQVVPDLDSLKFLSPQPGDKLAVIRANDWDWNDGRNTAFIRLRDILEIEFVSGSEVRVL